MVSDHDRRQLALIDYFVAGFERGDVSISDLVASIDALLDHLEDVEKSVLTQLSEAWEELEIGYAMGLDQRDPILYAPDQPEMRQACASLRGLVSTLLSP